MRWVFRLKNERDGIKYEKVLPYHVCTDEDIAEFYPIRPDMASKLERIRKDPDRGFLCIDWEDDDPLTLYGQYEHMQNYQEIDVTLAPCNYLHN